MKSGEIGSVPKCISDLAGKEVYKHYTGLDVHNAKVVCMSGKASLMECNNGLFNVIHECLIKNSGAQELNYDEEDVLMHIGTRKI